MSEMKENKYVAGKGMEGEGEERRLQSHLMYQAHSWGLQGF